MTKQITIDELIPLVDDKWKWAFCDSDGIWHLSTIKPEKGKDDWLLKWEDMSDVLFGSVCFFYKKPFYIKPFDGDWKDSLIKIKNGEVCND